MNKILIFTLSLIWMAQVSVCGSNLIFGSSSTNIWVFDLPRVILLSSNLTRDFTLKVECLLYIICEKNNFHPMENHLLVPNLFSISAHCNISR